MVSVTEKTPVIAERSSLQRLPLPAGRDRGIEVAELMSFHTFNKNIITQRISQACHHFIKNKGCPAITDAGGEKRSTALRKLPPGGIDNIERIAFHRGIVTHRDFLSCGGLDLETSISCQEILSGELVP